MIDARLARIVDSCAERLRPRELDEVDLQLINRLEALTCAAAEPTPAFRAGLRTQLLERAPELLVPAATDTEPPATARIVLAVDWRRRWRDLRRPIVAAVAVATVFFILMGTSVWLSKRALPGDALYGVKRASEDARISVTHGDAAKGKKYLQFASDRLAEISKLIGRSSATGSSKPSSDGLRDHELTVGVVVPRRTRTAARPDDDSAHQVGRRHRRQRRACAAEPLGEHPADRPH